MVIIQADVYNVSIYLSSSVVLSKYLNIYLCIYVSVCESVCVLSRSCLEAGVAGGW